jgi:hypothetical protein
MHPFVQMGPVIWQHVKRANVVKPSCSAGAAGNDGCVWCGALAVGVAMRTRGCPRQSPVGFMPCCVGCCAGVSSARDGRRNNWQNTTILQARVRGGGASWDKPWRTCAHGGCLHLTDTAANSCAYNSASSLKRSLNLQLVLLVTDM